MSNNGDLMGSEIKTQLVTREGIYVLASSCEYGRPKLVPYGGNANSMISGIGTAINTTTVNMTAGSPGGVLSNSSGPVTTGSGQFNQCNNIPVRVSFIPAACYSPQNSSSSSINEAVDDLPSNKRYGSNLDRSDSPHKHTLPQHRAHINSSSAGLPGQQYSHSSASSPPAGSSLIQVNGNQSSSSYDFERICFNIGRELFVFAFNALQVNLSYCF